MTELEIRMWNILRCNPVPCACTRGKYRAALTRLVKKGLAVIKQGEFKAVAVI